MACISTLEGDSAQAEHWERTATERAEALAFPRGAWSLGFARVYGAWMRTIAGDPFGAARLGEATSEIGINHGFPYFIGLGGVYADPSEPGAPGVIASAEQHVALLEAMGHRSMSPMLKANLARIHGHHGQIARAQATVDEAMALVERSSEWLSLPWVLLVQAELTTGTEDVAAAAYLVKANGLAARQGAHLLAVRAAAALADLPAAVRPDELAGAPAVRAGPHPAGLVLRRHPPGRRAAGRAVTTPASRGRVVILGGGMGALATALELTAGDWRTRLESVTVYQRGWRLGGKGASSRGVHGRIEEHGLHVLLGYYDQTFRLMRDCYDELDRARTDPSCPIPDVGRRGDPLAPRRGDGAERRHLGSVGGHVRAERDASRRRRRSRPAHPHGAGLPLAPAPDRLPPVPGRRERDRAGSYRALGVVPPSPGVLGPLGPRRPDRAAAGSGPLRTGRAGEGARGPRWSVGLADGGRADRGRARPRGAGRP